MGAAKSAREGGGMSILFLLIPLSVLLAAGFLGAFIWAVRSGQYEDTCTPAMRLLAHDLPPRLEPDAERGNSAGNLSVPEAVSANRAALPVQPASPGEPGRPPASILSTPESHP